MKLVFIHLLNNYSGSPNVLSLIIKEVVQKKYQVELLTNKSEGFLSSLCGVTYRFIPYRWVANNSLLTFIYFVVTQLRLFLLLLFLKRRGNIYYINTILPIGAILACYLTKKTFCIHVHENMKQQKILYILARFVYKYCNKKSVFVSEYVRSQALNVRDSIVVYNALGKEFLEQIRYVPFQERTTILMLCSLRVYKGIYEFITLAYSLPNYKFELVVSDSEDNVETFIEENMIPNNLVIFPAQTSVHPFYQRAKLVLNLSKPEYCIETFGLTLLEAMAYGIPVIGPMVGGPTEIIDNGKNGFLVDADNIEGLKEKINLLMSDNDLYMKMSEEALQKSKFFSLENMVNAIEDYLHLK